MVAPLLNYAPPYRPHPLENYKNFVAPRLLMKRSFLIALAFLALLLLGGLTYTGFVAYHTPQGIVLSDSITIPKAQLTDCCTFEWKGKTKTCSVVAPYDCSYCASYC